jgi:hypothetical protein
MLLAQNNEKDKLLEKQDIEIKSLYKNLYTKGKDSDIKNKKNSRIYLYDKRM